MNIQPALSSSLDAWGLTRSTQRNGVCSTTTIATSTATTTRTLGATTFEDEFAVYSDVLVLVMFVVCLIKFVAA